MTSRPDGRPLSEEGRAAHPSPEVEAQRAAHPRAAHPFSDGQDDEHGRAAHPGPERSDEGPEVEAQRRRP
jgi:hypothetical protein